jgi:hypothetical protein
MTAKLVAHPHEPAFWMLLDGNQTRGTISELPTGELYCCVDGEELDGCHFDLESAERTLRDAVTFKDIERATADAEWRRVEEAVEEHNPISPARGIVIGLLIVGGSVVGAIVLSSAVWLIKAMS